MQFNPACLSGPPINSTNVSCNSTGQQQQSEFINNIQSYTDTSSTNGWSNPIINSLPLYGIFNSSNLVPVPQDASQSQPQQQNSDANAKKKGSSKRTPPTTVKGDDLSPKIGGEDKSQGLDEEQKLKRQRRLLKNREAAQQFRQRQKEYIQNLERKVGELTGLVGESHKHIELLNTENRLLRDQLVYLYNVMRQNLSLTASPTASPSLNPQPSLITSPIPSMPNPAGMIDLSMLGFKGFDANTSFEEMLKSNPNPAPMQLLVPPPLTPLTSPAMTPNPSPSPSPMVSPMISPRIPDMGNLSLAKGLDMDALMCEGMNNPMFMARYGGYMKTGNNGNNGNNSNNGGGGGGGGDHNNEPQTVPELIIKAEGGGGNM